MNLTAILLLVACLQLSAKGLSQTVTLSLKDVPIQILFKEIERQTDYTFFAEMQWLKRAKNVTIEVKNLPLREVLDLCFKAQPFTYSISGKTITLAQRKDIVINADNSFQNKDIHGVITDENGTPAQGVNIVIKGTSKGATTNLKGEFILKDVDENAVLLITAVGYDKQEISVKNIKFVTTQLKVAVGNLDELQVIAYGTTSKRFNTGNVTTIKAIDIERQPVSNPLLALQGRVPGLFISQSTGLPNSGVTVRIQGQNSISKGNDPLYIIDGVPYSPQLLPSITGLLGNSGSSFSSGNPLSFINPSDIESIDVLKDADATAIYGSRAANGAILITTKRGKAGRTSVNITMQTGWGKVNRQLDLLDREKYLEMRYQAYANDGITISSLPQSNTSYDLTVWDTTRYTDWQKELIGGTANYANMLVSISGGNSTTQYLVGAGYNKETTVFPGNLGDTKKSLHFNINNVTPNQKFRFQISGNFLLDDNKLINRDLTADALRISPVAPALYNDDGTLNWQQLPNGNSTWRNPLSYLYEKYNTTTSNLIGNAIVSYELIPGLNIKSSFGYTNLQSEEINTGPLISKAPETRPNTTRQSIFRDNNMHSWIIEPQLNYKLKIWKGEVDMLVGSTFLKSNNHGEQFSAVGFSSDLVLEDIKSASTVSVNSTITSTYNYNALFSRFNYNIQNKYILNLSARRDGSSRFGSKNLFHDFGSIGAAWIFSSEDFIQKRIHFINFGKFRVSYGTTGNDQIGDYEFMNLYTTPSGVGSPYQGATGLQPNRLPNPYLEWEETKKLQIGLDLTFFRERIVLNANYYRNRSSNQLVNYALPGITGFNSIIRNFPATVQNSGWEFAVKTTNVKTNAFEWSTALNITIQQNKLLEYKDLATSTDANRLVIGKPITITPVYKLLGVNSTTGVFEFSDGKEGVTTRPDTITTSNIVLINTAPKFYGGFQSNFRYKRFELDVLFQFVKQIVGDYRFGNFPGRFSGTSNTGNQPVSVLDRWQKAGEIKSVQKYFTLPNFDLIMPAINANSSDGSYSDASYIRLKNVSLSWSLPEKIGKVVHLLNAKVFLQAQNLFTISNYKGLDPESRSSTSLPPLRVITIGLKLSL